MLAERGNTPAPHTNLGEHSECCLSTCMGDTGAGPPLQHLYKSDTLRGDKPVGDGVTQTERHRTEKKAKRKGKERERERERERARKKRERENTRAAAAPRTRT